jgi:hypothetical protein
MATKSSAGSPSFNLPDGQPIAAELVEADLRSRVTKCEATLEETVWQLALLYSTVGLHGLVTRFRAGPPIFARQADGHLPVGQFFEQVRAAGTFR